MQDQYTMRVNLSMSEKCHFWRGLPQYILGAKNIFLLVSFQVFKKGFCCEMPYFSDMLINIGLLHFLVRAQKRTQIIPFA